MSKEKIKSNKIKSNQTIKSSEIGELKPKPIFEGLSDDLKTVPAYNEIEKKILLIMKSDHTHRKVEAFVKCKSCSQKRQKRINYILQKGFRSYAQYLEWRKVMNIIIKQEDFRVL